MSRPLVSVIVTNYNYGKFLKRCIDSVLHQSYDNIQLIICDNASTDQSYSIISDYIKKDPNRITFIRSNTNLGSASNYINGERLIRGRFFMNLGADDYLDLDYLKVAVSLFEKHHNVSQIVSHADSIDDQGNVTCRPPFFDASYLIPGLSYASVLMVAGITAHTSQTIFSADDHFRIISRPDYIWSQTIGERTMAMMHAVSNDVIYLDKSFVTCRDSDDNESHKLNVSGFQMIEQLSVILAFHDYAVRHNLEKIYKRKDEAIKKLAELCKRYSSEMYARGNKIKAGHYLGMRLFLDGTYDEIFSGEDQKAINDILIKIKKFKAEVGDMAHGNARFRLKSYPPPEGAILLNY